MDPFGSVNNPFGEQDQVLSLQTLSASDEQFAADTVGCTTNGCTTNSCSSKAATNGCTTNGCNCSTMIDIPPE
jgi:hypothetical protein